MIDSTLDAIQDTQYIAYMEPIKAELEAQLNAPIGYAPKDLEVYQPECPMLNWASDALLAIARDLCPESVDVAVVNIGGMRCN
jgi:2',3'-cyclic-nucleotide 2'-phosphodiesterase (5'-nucleotidase family)